MVNCATGRIQFTALLIHFYGDWLSYNSKRNSAL